MTAARLRGFLRKGFTMYDLNVYGDKQNDAGPIFSFFQGVFVFLLTLILVPYLFIVDLFVPN